MRWLPPRALLGALVLACSSGGGGGGVGGADGGSPGGAGGTSGSAGSSGSGGSGATGGSSGSGGTSALDIHCEDGSDYCTCIQDTNGTWDPSESLPECSTSSPGTAVCCQDSTYPDTGTCQCTQVGCFESTSTCRCSSTEAGQPLTACQNSWPYCCAFVVGGAVQSCECSNIDLGCDGPNEQPVTSCSIDVLSCGSTKLPASDCKNP